MKRLLIALALIAAFVSPVFAQTWIQVGNDKSGEPIYLDTDSIRRISSVAFYTIKLPPIQTGEYAVVNSSMDCIGMGGQRQHKSLEFTTYDANGNQTDHWFHPKPEWLPVNPRSIADTIAAFVCPRRIQ